MPIRVMLADDHPATLAGVRATLERSRIAEVVGEAGSPRALLALLDVSPCDVLIMDYAMNTDVVAEGDQGREVRDGLDLLRQVRRRCPDLPVVMYTMVTNTALIQAMLDAGARAIISKADPVADLPAVLEVVCAGRVCLGKRVQEKLAQRGLASAFHGSGNIDISPREADVIRMLVNGMSPHEIGAALHRSPKTISNQKRSVMRKYGLTTDMELLVFASVKGLM